MRSDRNLETERLVTAMVDAFPRYLSNRLVQLGLVASGPVATAVAVGSDRLSDALSELLSVPPGSQAQSPLELVREATEPVSAALIEMGVRPPRRDEWEIDKHPADVFGLFPASSRDLGEEAWQLHLQWGIDKAQAVAGVVPAGEQPPHPSPLPSVALFGVPIEAREDLVSAVEARGYGALVWRNPAALETAGALGPIMVIVDLRHPKAHEAIRRLARSGTRTVATAGYVDDLMIPGLLALGAEEVTELGGLVDRLDRLLPRLV